MTPRQKIEIRLSEVRQRLNVIAGIEGDAFTDEVRNEAGALHTEFADLETRHRSSIMAEGETEARAAGLFGNQDGEAGERGRLLREANISDYLTPASAGSGIEGRAKELNAALELPDQGKGRRRGHTLADVGMSRTPDGPAGRRDRAPGFHKHVRERWPERATADSAKIVRPWRHGCPGRAPGLRSRGQKRMALNFSRRCPGAGEGGSGGGGGRDGGLQFRQFETETAHRQLRIFA